MWWSLAAVPPLVAAAVVRVLAPALVALVAGHVGQHRLLESRARVGLSVARLAHRPSVPVTGRSALMSSGQ